ncbi:unnamed protein product [Clonostachys solani]|uniref:Uncharacterized protein n=1 Tax=Clonostachys solani TaxID=160281 RepID=A0A9N9Z4X3_9HYPO|nr:unnamed protein product [Clonostachys solani]
MGLGTKIRGALSGDKGHRHSTSQPARKPPGAYPDSVADIPRSATVNNGTRTRTWETTTDTASTQRPSSVKDLYRTTEGDEAGEYTHSPVNPDSAAHQNNLDGIAAAGQIEDEELAIPSPDSRTAPDSYNKNAPFSTGSTNPQKYPYWGDVGKTNTQRDDVGTNGHHLERNGIASNGDYSARRGQAGAHGYDDDDTFETPIIATVNRGQPHMTDDEKRAISMAATELNQPSEYGDYAPTELPYRSAGHTDGHASHGMDYPAGSTANHYDDSYGVKQTPTVNGGGPSPTNARGTFGSPTMEYNSNVNGAAFPTANPKFAQEHIKEREQSSSVGGSSDGIGAAPAPKPAGADHYGPGHSGAKVLHRCEHCGNDNDITRYFSKDVVYRLS